MALDRVESTGDGGPGAAVAVGGPVDGSVLGSADAEAYEVRLTDGTRWDYVATGERQLLPDGSPAVVYRAAGRAP